MVFPTDALPPELIELILMLLGPDDIVNLGECVPLNITRAVYNNNFHDGTRFPAYDLEMFRGRARASFYAIGTGLEAEVLKIENTPDSPSYYEGNGDSLRMHTPLKLKAGGTIVQAAIDICRICFLDSNGKAYFLDCGDLYGEGPYTECGEPVLRMVNSDDTDDKHHHPVFKRLMTTSHVWGSDENGLLWQIDGQLWTKEGNFDWRRRLPIVCFDKGTGRRISKGIDDSMLSGYGFMILVRGRGVLACDPTMINNVPSWSKEELFASAEFSLYPGTEGAQSFCLFRCGIVCLWPDGTLSGITNGDGSEKVPEIIARVNKYGPFIQIATNTWERGFLAADGRVVVVSELSRTPMVVIDDFLGLKICHLAVEEGTYFVLTADGDVYTWGEEVSLWGHLGLGKLKEALKLEQVTLEVRHGTKLKVPKPVKLKLPGKAYAVYYGLFLSGFLIDDSKEGRTT